MDDAEKLKRVRELLVAMFDEMRSIGDYVHPAVIVEMTAICETLDIDANTIPTEKPY